MHERGAGRIYWGMKWIIGSLLTLAILATASCAWLGTTWSHPKDAATAAASLSEAPLSEPPQSEKIQVSAQQLELAVGPPLEYRTFKPKSTHAPHQSRRVGHKPWVILAHGFLRDQRHMQGLAMALAEAGFPVATLNSRHDSPISGGHVAHGRDMIALARELGTERVIYAGFSAGGLAALLAASSDPKASGLLTLDLVDSQGLGRQAAKSLGVPLIALTGAPSNCNANNNTSPIYQSASAISLTRIPQASHCDFEAPSDWLCRLVCQQPSRQTKEQAEPSRLQQDIIQSAVAGIRQLADS
ncbi:putative dienelactone hydrolase [Thiorhodovibrio winogradskyi]|uniref:Dienelactone hydrolase n=1 Tax=Thiorhodovibrio winogradskyi TaxID=77007 RepID=A0ABZ0SCJ7_9GAMM|nr:alpha/beta hydrolase [Thiorhodovibrio winogradskyi]